MKRIYVLSLLTIGIVWLSAGCAGTEEAGRPAESTRPSGRVSSGESINLAGPASDVGVVQLYPDGAETDLPILQGGRPLVLEFDLMGDTGRPLSVYFYHADRNWQRDLSPVEYMTGYRRDNLTSYSSSRATLPSYTHYEYTFPNDQVNFSVSGNYILRVTEQGAEEEVLFEQPFFVSEGRMSPRLSFQRLMVGGGSGPSIQPILQFTPPGGIGTGAFDYNACFFTNGRYKETRCSDRARPAQQGLQFELDPQRAFEAQGANYFLDLSDLRVGAQIAGTNLSATPGQVILEPDYARFPDGGEVPLLHGQSRLSGTADNVAEPDLAAEYVEVRFSYVPPDERPLSSAPIITGSFNNWQREAKNAMTWQPDSRQYEGTVLIKQGQYEYHYVSEDPRLRQELRRNLPRTRNLYTAFVYYADASLGSDRLLAVQQDLLE